MRWNCSACWASSASANAGRRRHFDTSLWRASCSGYGARARQIQAAWIRADTPESTRVPATRRIRLLNPVVPVRSLSACRHLTRSRPPLRSFTMPHVVARSGDVMSSAAPPSCTSLLGLSLSMFVAPCTLTAAPLDTPVVNAPAPTPPTPDQAYPELFQAVQSGELFDDQKHFVDFLPLRDPALINATIWPSTITPVSTCASSWTPISKSRRRCRPTRSVRTPRCASTSICCGPSWCAARTTCRRTAACCRCRTRTWCRAGASARCITGIPTSPCWAW